MKGASFGWFRFLWLCTLVLSSCRTLAEKAGNERVDVALSVLSFNVYGHPLLAPFQRPERFAKISTAIEKEFSDTMFIALQESHVPNTEILARAYAHQVEGACGVANEFRPTGLRVLSNLSPDQGIERYYFNESERGDVELISEDAVDCVRLRAARQTKKGFLAVPFTVRGHSTLLVNLHLSPSIQRRKQEKEILLSWLSTKPAAWSVVLAGDFNEDLCARQSVRKTWARHRLQSLTCSLGATVGGWRKGIWQGAFFGGQLDHILLRGAFDQPERRRVFRHAQDGMHFSDHDGVWGRWVPNP